MVKVVVDRKPNDWTECMYAEKRPHDIFYAQCKLSGNSCGLDSCGRCDRLISIYELRGW